MLLMKFSKQRKFISLETGSHHRAQAGLELSDPPTTTSPVLELQTFATISSNKHFICSNYTINYFSLVMVAKAFNSTTGEAEEGESL